MEHLSISQSYLLCVLTEKGRLPVLGTESQLCLVAGGVLDLILDGCVTLNKKELTICGEPDGSLRHLNSLFELIQSSGKLTLDKLVSEYCFSFMGKKIAALTEAVGASLAQKGCVRQEKGGVFDQTACFIPEPTAVDHIVQSIRAEVLENGDLSEEIAALVSLLDKSGQIKKYFSKYEKNQLKERLAQVRKEDSGQMVKTMMDYIETMLVVITAITVVH